MVSRLLRPIAAVALATFSLGAMSAQAEEIRIYNWSDYIDAQILKDFTAETGINVVYDTFDTNELLETKLLTGGTGYDIVVPTATFLSRQIKAGVFQKLDKSKLTNLKNMWPEIRDRVSIYDPGNEYSVTYMWGTTGIGINAAKVKAALPNAPVNSWGLIYDPANAEKLASCGIMVLDSAEDLLPSVMNFIGVKPDFKDAADIEKAGEHLGKVRSHIRKFHSDEWKNALADGDICVAVGYSGDVFQVATRAEEAGKGVEIQYVIPKEGAQLWFDQFAIPADAPNTEGAHKFIDYMMRPEVIAKATNYVAYANANLASQQFVDKEILDNPAIYPDAETLKRLYTVSTVEDPRLQRVITRTWTRAKTGQ
ncbi:polyamine ABC transporter substrate-binding protein [Terrihabitans sp. B22-R8]|uniref:polyamine ABC transporter substrate-binding protein n=1 Tax=Terrihabitans sp. B22-R8 TaxID=3425128 RepID=UPI00403C5B8C